MLKYLLLALLADEPRHGYELKGVFEDLLGGTWPLNIAQVYTALGRLEREGLVECRSVSQSQAPDRKVYHLTSDGRAELQRWVKEPDDAPVSLRDSFIVKVLVAATLPNTDAIGLIWAQREASLKVLSDLQAARDDADLSLATSLLLDAGVERLRADLRWLDHCEERLADAKQPNGTASQPAANGESNHTRRKARR